MALKVGELVAYLRLDKSGYTQGLADARSAAAETGNAIAKSFEIGAKSVGVLSTAATGAVVSLQKVGAGYNILSQTARASLSAIMGSAAAANAQMDELFKFTQTSPLPKQAFIQAQQTLIGFGVEAKKVVPILDAINDAAVATGTGAEGVDRLSTAVAKVESQGKLTGDALFQMGSMGIDAAQMVADSMGKTVDETRKSITAGAIGADQAIAAIVAGMEKRYGGASANVKDQFVGAADRIKAAWRDLGSVLNAPLINPNGGGNLVVWFNDVADVIRATQHLAERFMAVLHDQDAGASLDHIHTALQDIAGWIDRIDYAKVSAFLDTLREYAPVLAGIAAGFVTLGAQQIPFVGSLVAAWNPWVVALGATATALPEVRDLVVQLFNAVKPLVPVVGDLIGVASTVITIVQPLVGLLADVVKWFTDLPGPVQLAVAAFAAMAVFHGPILTFFTLLPTRIGLAGLSLATFGRQAASTVTSLSGLSKAGSSLMGVFGGPWGIAIAGAVTGVGLLIKAWQDAKPEVVDFTAAVDENTGSLAANAAQAAANAMQEHLKAWKEAGGDVAVYTDAVLGNADAQAKMEAAFAKNRAQLVEQSIWWPKASEYLKAAGLSISDVEDALGRVASGAPGAWQAFVDQVQDANVGVTDVESSLLGLLNAFHDAQGQTMPFIEQYNTDVSTMSDTLENARIVHEAFTRSVTGSASAAADADNAQGAYVRSILALADASKQGADATDDLDDSLKTLDDRVRSLTDSMHEAVSGTDLYNRAVIDLVGAQQDAAQAMTDTEYAAKKSGDSVFDAAGSFDLSQSAVRDMVDRLYDYRDSAYDAAAATYATTQATAGADAAQAAAQQSLAGARQGFIDMATSIWGISIPAAEAIANELGLLQTIQIDDKTFTVTMVRRTVDVAQAEGQYSDSWMRRINQEAAAAASNAANAFKMPSLTDLMGGVTPPKPAKSGGGGGGKSGKTAAQKAADDAKRAAEKAQKDAERRAEEAARKEQKRQEDMARTVSGTFDQIGRAVQKPFSVAEFGIKGIENQLARSQRSLDNAISKGLDPKKADALRKELASLTAEAQKQLSNLRIKISTADLDNFRASLDDSVSAMHQSMEQLVKDLKATGAASATIKALGGIETALAAAMTRREQITQELSAAQATLNGLMDQYRQRVDAVTDSFTSFAAVTNVEASDRWGNDLPMEAIIAQMEDRAKIADKFTKDVEALRRSGLNETTLQQIISAGPGTAAAQASVLASATSAELQKINSLTAQVFGDGRTMGSLSAESMYRSGINAAQAVVDGLIAEQTHLQETIENLAGSAEILVASEMKKQGSAAADGVIAGLNARKPALIATMETLGKEMTKAFKKSLDINSPSGVMAREVGVPVVDGVIVGMRSRTHALAAAAADMRGNLLGGDSGYSVSRTTNPAGGKLIVEIITKGEGALTGAIADTSEIVVRDALGRAQDISIQRQRAGVRQPVGVGI